MVHNSKDKCTKTKPTFESMRMRARGQGRSGSRSVSFLVISTFKRIYVFLITREIRKYRPTISNQYRSVNRLTDRRSILTIEGNKHGKCKQRGPLHRILHRLPKLDQSLRQQWPSTATARSKATPELQH